MNSTATFFVQSMVPRTQKTWPRAKTPYPPSLKGGITVSCWGKNVPLASEVAANVTLLDPGGKSSPCIFCLETSPVSFKSQMKLGPITFIQKLICWMKMGMIKGTEYRFSYFTGRRVNYPPNLCENIKNGKIYPLEILIPNKCVTARTLGGIYSVEAMWLLANCALCSP